MSHVRVAALALSLVPVFGCSDRKAAAQSESAHPVANKPAPSLDGLPLDTGGLSDGEKSSLGHLLQKYPSACGKAHALDVSLKSDPGCKRSVYAARYLVKLLKAHFLESEVEEQYEQRYQQTAVSIDTSASPLRGDAHAPITLVEFSDFQCPHCKHLQPTLERALDEYRGQIKLYFKNFPLSSVHPDSAGAAAGAIAAGKQGKFWQFHDRLFGGDQEHEAQADLDKIAHDLKLDFKKWQADLPAAAAQVAKDRAEGEKLEINSTPTLYINGKHYRGGAEFDELKDWLDEEINR